MPTKEEEKKRQEEKRLADQRARVSGNPALGAIKPYKVHEGIRPQKGTFTPQAKFTPESVFTQKGGSSNIQDNTSFSGFKNLAGTQWGGAKEYNYKKGSGTLDALNRSYAQNPPSMQGGKELPIDAKAREMMQSVGEGAKKTVQGVGEGAKNRYAEMAQTQTWKDLSEGMGKTIRGFADAGKAVGSALAKGPNEALERAKAAPIPNLLPLDWQKPKQPLPITPPPGNQFYGGTRDRIIDQAPKPGPYIGQEPAPQTTHPPQTQTSQAPPTAMQNQPSYQGKTGNRYLDMAYAGSDELQKYIQGMPEGDRPIDLIRGTQRSFYDPRSQQEYATMAEAAFGVSRPDIMEQYGIDAPMQSRERLAFMEMMGQGQEQEKPEYVFDQMMGAGGESMVRMNKRTGEIENLGPIENIQRLQEMASPQDLAEFYNTVIPDMMSAVEAEDAEAYQKKRNKLQKENPALFMLWEQYTGEAK